MSEPQAFCLALLIAYGSIIGALVMLNHRLKQWNSKGDPPPPVASDSPTAEVEIPPFARRRRFTDL